MAIENGHDVDRLGEYWNGVIRGEPTPMHDPVDPALAATVRRIQSLGPVVQPDPRFASRLWQELVPDERPHRRGQPKVLSGGAAGRTGNDVAMMPPRAVVRSSARFGRWWARVEAAAAVVLVVLLAGGLILLNEGRRAGPPTESGTRASPTSDPANDPARWVFTGGGSAPNRLRAGEDGRVEVRLRRIFIDVGATWTAEAPAAFQQCVLVGLVTLKDEPAAGGARLDNRSCLEADGLASITNDGFRRAVILQAAIGPLPEAEPPVGVVVDEMGRGKVGPFSWDQAFVWLDRSRMDRPESGSYGGPVGVDLGDEAVALVAVESGTVDFEGEQVAVEVGGSSITSFPASSATPLAPSTSLTINEGDLAIVQAATSATGHQYELRPVEGNQPPVVVTVVIERDDRAGPPQEDFLFVRGRFQPSESGLRQATLLLRRISLQPGAAVTQTGSGTVLHEVVEGNVTVGSNELEGAVTLVSGQPYAEEVLGTLTISNPSRVRATVIQAVVTTGDLSAADLSQVATSGANVELLGAGTADLLPGAADVLLVRQSIDGPEGGFDVLQYAGTDLVAVETGRLTLSRLSGQVELQRRAGLTGATPVASESMTAGGQVEFLVGDSAIVRYPAAYGLNNPDPSPASVLILSLEQTDATPVATPGEAHRPVDEFERGR